MQSWISLVGRILLSTLFILAGYGKIMAYAATQGYMEHMGVPGALLPLVILTELGGGLAILVGYQTKIVAFLLAGFTLLAAFIFHFNFSDQTQSIMFMKNLSITGGFLSLLVSGAGALSLDAVFNKNKD